MPLGRCVTMAPALFQFSVMSHENDGREMGVLRTVNSRPRLRVAAPFRLNKMNPVAYGPRMSLTIWSFVVARYAVASSPRRPFRNASSTPPSTDRLYSGFSARLGPQKSYPYPPNDVVLNCSDGR